MAGSLELRYKGWSVPETYTLSPYAFYDIGRVWNMDDAQEAYDTASSIGVGMRLSTEFHMSANVGVAFPLIRDVGTPIYGDTGSSPRLLLEVSQSF